MSASVPLAAIRPPDASLADVRVLHVASWFGALSETFVPETIVQTERLGWRAALATRAVENRELFPDPPDPRILLGRVTPPRGRLRELVYGTDYGTAEWAVPAALVPEVIHAHFGWSALDALPLARSLGRPLVVTFHGTDATVYPLPRRRLRPLTRALGLVHRYEHLWPSVTRVVVVSRFVEDKVRELGFTGPVDVVPAGVPLEAFPFREADPDPGSLRLLVVARQEPVKGVDVLMRALPAVLARHPALSVQIIGEGPVRAANERLAGELGLAGQVTFRGGLPRGEVHRALESAHVLVHCSRTMPNGQAEGSPVITKEALATGLQVVATDTGGTAETLPERLRDEVVPEEDPAALARALLEIVDRRAEWPARAAAGREWVERRFAWDALARELAETYRRASEGRAA
jgi:colanic acid/amylovoran biosynthesis glycosyltransferase